MFGSYSLVRARRRGSEARRSKAAIVLAIASLLGSLAAVTPAAPVVAVTIAPGSPPIATYVVSDGSGGACDAAADVTTGDYVEDEAGAIQAALNLAATDGTVGIVVVHLCAGTYDLSTGISITSGDDTDPDSYLRIEGEDSANTVVRLSPEASATDFSLFKVLHDDGAGIAGIDVVLADLTATGAQRMSDNGGVLYVSDVSSPDPDYTVGIETARVVGNRGNEGGAIYTPGSVSIVDSSFSDNTAGAGWGGAIRASGDVNVVGSSFVANWANAQGGAIATDTTAGISDSLFTDNTSGDAGGAVYAALSMSVARTTLLRNSAQYFGGALEVRSSEAGQSFVITDSTVGDNVVHAYDGGAIMSWAPVTVTRVAFFRNVAAGNGGAIAMDGEGSPGITIVESAFDANEAGTAGGAIMVPSAATIENATFYENTASTGAGGGALMLDSSLTASLTNVTFVRNASANGGSHVDAVGALDVTDSIFADGTCAYDSGSTTSDTYSFDTSSTCPATAATLGELNLGIYRNWGGPTKTVKLLSPSVAIDAHPNSGGACTLGTDQRGRPRPESTGGDCDAGAYEVPVTVVTYTGPSVVFTSGDSANVTLSGTTYPALEDCDLEFVITPDGGVASGPYTVTTGLKGSGSVTVYGLATGVYGVVVNAVGDCKALPDASGAFVVANATIGKGTAGGGAYKVDGLSGRAKFAHTVQVTTVTKKVGKASITTTTTKGSLLWTYKNAWRVKASINYASTDGSSSYGRVSCSSGDFSGGTPTGSGWTCGRFSGAALLQTFDPELGIWVDSDYANVTFVVTVFDGGTKSTCVKNKCTLVEVADWFGIRIKWGATQLGLAEGIPTSLMRTLASPNGNGSLKSN